jgi:hypothetical protein
MERNGNCWRIAIALGMLAMLGVQISAASADPTSVPFKEDVTEVSFTVTGVNGSLVSGVEIDAGQATHFGTVLVTFDVTIDRSTRTLTGTATDVTANGDLVKESRTGMLTGAASGLVAVQYITYTGGTGRFQDLTGSSIILAYRNPTTGGVLTQEITGTISY